MPAYINTGPDPADLPETRGPGGEIHRAVTVPPGGQITWPYPIAGFTPVPAKAPGKNPPASKDAAPGGEAK